MTPLPAAYSCQGRCLQSHVNKCKMARTVGLSYCMSRHPPVQSSSPWLISNLFRHPEVMTFAQHSCSFSPEIAQMIGNIRPLLRELYCMGRNLHICHRNRILDGQHHLLSGQGVRLQSQDFSLGLSSLNGSRCRASVLNCPPSPSSCTCQEQVGMARFRKSI